MSIIAKKTLSADLEKEMEQSYLDYAMSVILGRALPDVRDGLKPVHRRILYAMLKLGNAFDKPYKKSARVTGDVIGKYHPHGETAIYDAIVRMAQDFSMRYPLVDGQGNFGSVDGDRPAAMRYTEVRLSRIGHELLTDIEKETVNFGPNYDETEEQPLVLPARLPNLLLNGSEGIAVGMSTKVPPHNLTETVDACRSLIEDPDITIDGLMHYLPGPDFPTSGIINGDYGIIRAYKTGSGTIRVRGKVEVEESETSNKQALIVTELPYQVNKAMLITKIASLVKTGILDGISTIRDETDKSGMRVVIELRTDANSEIVEKMLYTRTSLEVSYGINFVVIENNEPKLFNLKQILQSFIQHRKEVVTRKLEFELRKALARAHTLEGFAVALTNIDKVIEIIRAAGNRQEAKENLMAQIWSADIVLQLLKQVEGDPEVSSPIGNLSSQYNDSYRLSERQVDEILKMPLQSLTGMERDKVFEEFKAISAQIVKTQKILRSSELLLKEIDDELNLLKEQFGKNDERRTEIRQEAQMVDDEDLIERQDVIVTISHAGYAKQQPVSEYRSQRRGGVGSTAATHKADDFVSQMFAANTHDTLLCFTNLGKVYWTKVFRLQRASRTARGRPLVNVIPALTESEKVTAVLPLSESNSGRYVFMTTRLGLVKKCEVEKFSRIRSSGIRALTLREDDELVNVEITDGQSDILIASSYGRIVRFSETAIRASGRTSLGVRGIKLEPGQKVISMFQVEESNLEKFALLVSSDGKGKRTNIAEFPRKSRGTKGVFILPATKRGHNEMIDARLVDEKDQIVLITDKGTLIRTEIESISKLSRKAGGVRIIKLQEGASLAGLAIVSDVDSENGNDIDNINANDVAEDEQIASSDLTG